MPQSPTSLPSEKESRRSRSSRRRGEGAAPRIAGPKNDAPRAAVAIDELGGLAFPLFVEDDGERRCRHAAENALSPVAHLDEAGFTLRDGSRGLVTRQVPDLIGYDEGNEAAREQLDRPLQEERMRRWPAAAFIMVGIIAAQLARKLDRVAAAEGEIRRIADHHVESALREDFGELFRPAKRPRPFEWRSRSMSEWPARRLRSRRGSEPRLPPPSVVETREQEGKLGDVDCGRVDVHAEDGVLQDRLADRQAQAKLAVRAGNECGVFAARRSVLATIERRAKVPVEQSPVSAEQESPAATRRVEHAHARRFLAISSIEQPAEGALYDIIDNVARCVENAVRLAR